MGCEASVPVREKPINIGKTERRPRQVNHVPVKVSSKNTGNDLVASNSSRGGNSTVSLVADEELSDRLPMLDENGQLMPEEVVRRTSSCLSVSRVVVGDKDKYGREVEITYAYRSQRGYYPDEPKKANQDKYGISLSFAGEPGDLLFSVYDGHGKQGHDAAAFAKKKLPQFIAKYVRQKRAGKFMRQLREEGKSTKGAWNPSQWPLLSVQEFEECCRKSYLETNEAMHAEKTFNDRYCGTTAVSVAFHGGRMTVCNVGDSRVLLGRRTPTNGPEEESKEEEKVEIETEMSNNYEPARTGEVVPIPLTWDQTPNRKDERERVEKIGAEIRTVDGKILDDWGDFVHNDTINVDGDPPRIWFFGKDYPGCAFTRSLGDRAAEDIGVVAEPEIMTKTLTKNDEFLVIASDGIFEFLTNAYVMNVCATSLTPLEACERLTRDAYDQWLVHENRTDDITIIVCFLSCTHNDGTEKDCETTESLTT